MGRYTTAGVRYPPSPCEFPFELLRLDLGGTLPLIFPLRTEKLLASATPIWWDGNGRSGIGRHDIGNVFRNQSKNKIFTPSIHSAKKPRSVSLPFYRPQFTGVEFTPDHHHPIRVSAVGLEAPMYNPQALFSHELGVYSTRDRSAVAGLTPLDLVTSLWPAQRARKAMPPM